MKAAYVSLLFRISLRPTLVKSLLGAFGFYAYNRSILTYRFQQLTTASKHEYLVRPLSLSLVPPDAGALRHRRRPRRRLSSLMKTSRGAKDEWLLNAIHGPSFFKCQKWISFFWAPFFHVLYRTEGTRNTSLGLVSENRISLRGHSLDFQVEWDQWPGRRGLFQPTFTTSAVEVRSRTQLQSEDLECLHHCELMYSMFLMSLGHVLILSLNIISLTGYPCMTLHIRRRPRGIFSLFPLTIRVFGFKLRRRPMILIKATHF